MKLYLVYSVYSGGATGTVWETCDEAEAEEMMRRLVDDMPEGGSVVMEVEDVEDGIADLPEGMSLEGVLDRGGVLDNLALLAIRGCFGNGDARKEALGAFHDAVQARVDHLLAEGRDQWVDDVDGMQNAFMTWDELGRFIYSKIPADQMGDAVRVFDINTLIFTPVKSVTEDDPVTDPGRDYSMNVDSKIDWGA